jgi:methylenetetrahydrofolate dehydrogenase (NADP+) / methenyltetrahydrofolate cyclohydrolase
LKLLDGRDVASYIQMRHVSMAAGLSQRPKLAIVCSSEEVAAGPYVRAKTTYGEDIGVPVDVYTESKPKLSGRLVTLNADSSVTGIIIQLPLSTLELTEQAVTALDPAKDVDGCTPNSPFEPATPKAILWLLAAYNVDIKGHIVIVGQGRLVGKPLADRLEAAGHAVTRCDDTTPDLAAATRTADLLVTGTGHRHLITPDMVKDGVVVVDAGSPEPELAPELYDRPDLTLTPNPGGVGPMTVASLFDNLLIGAQNLQK